MSESVNLPALGESVTEGTVTRWLKNVGDRVEVDEPLLEVSTDKVDTEIPSPIAGVIEAILVAETRPSKWVRRSSPSDPARPLRLPPSPRRKPHRSPKQQPSPHPSLRRPRSPSRLPSPSPQLRRHPSPKQLPSL